MNKKVSIIILNWNKWDDTIECLKSVYAMNYRNFEIILIDNASADDSVERIKGVFPDVWLVENSTNLGFTGGNNQGIKLAMQAGADYVWLLNNDTVVEENSLTNLVNAAEKSDCIAMVSPIIYFHSDSSCVQFKGSKVDRDNLTIKYLKGESWDKDYTDGPDVCLWGTALLIKSGVINKLGVLREDYFAYYEDTEYSLRMLANNYSNRMVTNAVIWHKNKINEGAVFIRDAYYHYYMIRNDFFMWSDQGNGYKKKAFEKLITRSLHSAAQYYRSDYKEHALVCIQALVDALLNKRGKQTNPSKIHRFLLRAIMCCPYLMCDIILLNIRSVLSRFVPKHVNG